ncbi:SRPBCC family protein [Streptomyces jumonjinensis]|uniref:SRPBCC family protein n=1 Tax=Streptomyces jumonjinensis TaxID=1945 RepID=UPI0037A1660C
MTTSVITLDEYAELINRASGAGITSEELLDPAVAFEALGVDSLGGLGVVSELELRLGLEPDSGADGTKSPFELLLGINRRSVDAGLLQEGHTEQSIVIDASYDEVWHQTNDVAAWPELFSEYAKAEILETSGSTVTFRLSMHPDENGTVWSWVSERTTDRENGTVRAHRVETGPFEFMNIAWTYREVKGGTEMRWVQDFRMKPQAPVDTAAMTARITTNSTLQLALIRGRVQERARLAAV